MVEGNEGREEGAAPGQIQTWGRDAGRAEPRAAAGGCAGEQSAGGKVTLVPGAIVPPRAWSCGSLLCSQPLLQEAGTQCRPGRVPPVHGMGRPVALSRC